MDSIDELLSRARADTEGDFRRWLDQAHEGLRERLDRLRIIEPSYRLDCLHEAVPASELAKVRRQIGARSYAELAHESPTVWRALPASGCIRPGDWVALDRAYAQQHLRGDAVEVARLDDVDAQHIYWSGTDMNEYFYLPQPFVKPDLDTREYCVSLGAEGLRIVRDGEMASVRDNSRQLQAIMEAVMQIYDEDTLGMYHGPDHWRRVVANSIRASRSLGIDPLPGVVFGWVHDSQRWDENSDPLHGPRAAQFVRDNAGPGELFGFLPEHTVQEIATACELHSDGMTEGSRILQACWDADRLDLWRVGVQPDPDCLCTDWAKQPHIIAAARHCAEASFEDGADHAAWPAARMR